MSTYHLVDFAGGRDIRPGKFSAKEKNRFAELDNYVVTKGKKLRRRPPMGADAGEMSSDGTDFVDRGLVEVDGTLWSFQPRDVTGTDSLASVDVGRFLFDRFPGIVTDGTYEVLDAVAFSGVVCALIREGSTAIAGSDWWAITRLHVFDGANAPTYVDDPWFPTPFTKRVPLHLYGQGDRGVPAWDNEWRPSITVAKGKLWISGADGDPWGCAINKPRVWNEREAEDHATDGEWTYRLLSRTGTAGAVETVTVPVKWTDLQREDLYSSYVLEYLRDDGDGMARWYKFGELRPGVDMGAALCRFRARPVTAPWSSDSAVAFYAHPTVADGVATQYQTTLSYADFVANEPRLVFDGDALTGGYTATNIAGLLRLDFITAPSSGHTIVAAIIAHPEGNDGSIDDIGPHATSISFIRPTDDDLVVRLRVLTAPPPITVTGAAWADADTRAAGTFLFEDERVARSAAVVATTPPAFDTQSYCGVGRVESAGSLAYGHDGALFGYYTPPITPGRFDVPIGVELIGPILTGFDRYHHRFSHGNENPSIGTVTFGLYERSVFPHIKGYGSYPDGKESTLYLARAAYYEAIAGFGQAGNLPTKASENDGGGIRGLCAIKNRLLVFYTETAQLWSVNADLTQDELLDVIQVGLGSRVMSPLTGFFGDVIGLSQRGIRSFSVQGNNSDSAQDANIGDAIEEMGGSTCICAGFWPYTGQYLCVMKDNTTDELTMLGFDFSREQKISAWSTWTVVDLPEPTHPRFVAIGNRLYFRSAGKLYWFDADATAYRDVTDGATAYQSRAVWHFSDFDRPGYAKTYQRFDAVFSGNLDVAFRLLMRGVATDVPGFPLRTSTYGGEGVGLCMYGDALSLVLSSTDETGSEVESIAITFDYKKR
jgi:hypothetical protein